MRLVADPIVSSGDPWMVKAVVSGGAGRALHASSRSERFATTLTVERERPLRHR
jgi:hypothetical protein